MNKLTLLGIIGGAALLTAVPFSLQWSQNKVALSVDSAHAQMYGYGLSSGYGYPAYSYGGYGYPAYSYGGYGYPAYSYGGYGYPAYSYGGYGYGYPAYSYGGYYRPGLYGGYLALTRDIEQTQRR
jgi:hypothetical protein